MILVTDPRTLHVMQGRLRLGEGPDDVLVTILGSCVAACFRDPVMRIGGMNHFLLPGDDPHCTNNVRYGAQSMEQLVNALILRGADRRRLEVWLFGGASVLGQKTGIGAANGVFAQTYVRTEGFTLRSEDLGGQQGRKLRFHPHSGQIDVSVMASVSAGQRPGPASTGGDIELF